MVTGGIRMYVNLNKTLPHLAARLPLVTISMSLLVHIMKGDILNRSNIKWIILGVLASIYYEFFCKEL